MSSSRVQPLYLDIETVPTQRPAIMAQMRAEALVECEAAIAAIAPPGNLKKAETIKVWEEETKPLVIAEKRANCESEFDAAYRKTALNGTLGEVAVVGFAVGDDEPDAVVRDMSKAHGEKALLIHAFESLPTGRPLVVGHNVVEFDLRFLFQRAMVNQVPFPPELKAAMDAKPWEGVRVYDTMTQWAGFKNRVSLDNLCKAFGIQGKGDIDGSKVWDYVKAGRISEIAEYCKNDVRMTREVYKRMKWESFLPLREASEDADVPY